MAVSRSPVLDFPAMLRGPTGTVRRQVSAQVKEWSQEYLKTGGFTPPQRMLSVPPGEPLLMHAAAEFEFLCRPATWRVHLFLEAPTDLYLSVPDEERPRIDEAFEAFCLNTEWGALCYAVDPPPPWNAEHMARRLAALLRFWDVLHVPRYTRWTFQKYTLEELVDEIYRPTLETWCPGGPSLVRDHLALTVECLSRATRGDCLEAVLRMIPGLVRLDARFEHPEVLSDPDFLRARLALLSPEDFEDISGTYRYRVATQLHAWDRLLGHH